MELFNLNRRQQAGLGFHHHSLFESPFLSASNLVRLFGRVFISLRSECFPPTNVNFTYSSLNSDKRRNISAFFLRILLQPSLQIIPAS